MNQVQIANEPSTGSIPITFKYNGQVLIIKELGREFEKSLTQLLRRANVAGPFVVTCAAKVKGRPHTQGLTIGSPNGKHRAVEMCWQEGSNDGRYSFLISCPSGTDAMGFHSRLKAAHAALDAEDETYQVPKPPGKEDGFAVHVAEHHTGKETVVSVNFTPSAAPVARKEESSSNVVGANDAFAAAADKAKAEPRFVDDPLAIGLFLDECLKYATPTGMVPRVVCANILKEHFRYIRTGSVFESLVMKGHLEAIHGDKTHYQISAPWLTRLRPDPASDAVSAAIVAQPSAAETIQKPQDLAKVELDDPRTLAARIGEWTKKAKMAADLRKRLAEVEGELKGIDSLRQSALERRARFEAALKRPEIVEAEQVLAAIQKALPDS